MHSPANDPRATKHTTGWPTSLPPVIWSVPAIGAGIGILLLRLNVPNMPGFSLELLSALYAFWLLCIWQIHRVLAFHTQGTYAIKPLPAVILNVIGGPLSAWLASLLCEQLLRALNASSDLIGEVMPSSLPVINSAVSLMGQYGTILAVAIACGAAVCCQEKIFVTLRAFLEDRHQSIGRHRSLVAAGLLGIALATPGVLWLLGSSAIAWQFTGDPGWKMRLEIISYACASLSFAILIWMTSRLRAAVSAPPNAAETAA
jgi:hypothetical protein